MQIAQEIRRLSRQPRHSQLVRRHHAEVWSLLEFRLVRWGL